MSERVVLEPIQPDPASFDTRMMAAGRPGLPHRFRWRDRDYEVAEVLGTSKRTSVDRGDVYLRRHIIEIRTQCGTRMKLAGERHPRGGAPRWILRTIDEAE